MEETGVFRAEPIQLELEDSQDEDEVREAAKKVIFLMVGPLRGEGG